MSEIKFSFEHPSGVTCVVVVDALPREGETIVLIVHDYEKPENEQRTEEWYRVAWVRHQYSGALRTRGGAAQFTHSTSGIEVGLMRQ